MAAVRRRVREIVVLACLAAWGGWAASAGSAIAAPAPRLQVPELRLSGVVDPFVASYVEDAIAGANRSGNAAVLITIDTPGGLDSSMRTIIRAILGSRIPVLCYTSPSGARAASAGTFIMLACPVAAMAPGTNIGAAHPVGVAGAIEQEKVTNDAAAFIRSLAERWGRNADWAEKAVRDSISVSAEEAARIHVIDFVAPSVRELFRVANPECSGRPVAPRTRPDTGLLNERGSIPSACADGLVARRMGLGVSILHGLISPDFAFLFFYLGLGLIVLELLHPGVSVPGILGTLFLVTAFVSFGLLPVQLVGVALLVASAVFFLLELKHPGLGLPTAGGLITLVLGGLFLFNPAVPSARVSLWVLGVVAAALAVFFGFVVRAVMEARRMPKAAGPEDMTGEEGVALTDLAPAGQVRARRETWSARSDGPPIAAGTAVRVVARDGLHLVVEPAGSRPSEATKEGEPVGLQESPTGLKGGTS